MEYSVPVSQLICDNSANPVVLNRNRPENSGICTLKILNSQNSVNCENNSPEDYVILFTNETDKNRMPIFSKIQRSDLLELVAGCCPPKILMTVLQQGVYVVINDKKMKFNYFGQSPSMLRKKKCMLYNAELGNISDVLLEFGNFDRIQNISKRSARIGLLMSSCMPLFTISDDEILTLPDITSQGEDESHVFTDGCGLVSVDIAKKMSRPYKGSKKYENHPYKIPSVYQIRMMGYKGVLMLDVNLQKGIVLRESMKKFDWNAAGPHLINIIQVSSPCHGSNLNGPIIRLLSSLGVKDDIFFNKFINDLKKKSKETNVVEMLKELCFNLRSDKASIETYIKKVKSYGYDFSSFCPSDIFLNNGEKLRISVEKSRTLFGVCDPTGTLEYGECFLQVTNNGDPVVISNETVAVTKNPCYHPGDVRVLKTVDNNDLRHLVDCIVFPTRGSRPHCHEIAGGDLDGDLFFITWDTKLIPPKTISPAKYIPLEKQLVTGEASNVDLLKHFCYFKKTDVAEVNRLFLTCYQNKGGLSEECMRLSELFKQAVDMGKKGGEFRIPDELYTMANLEKMESKILTSSMEILQRLVSSRKNSEKSNIESTEAPMKNTNIDKDQNLYFFSRSSNSLMKVGIIGLVVIIYLICFYKLY